MRRFPAFGAALVADLVGGGGAVLAASRHWQTITVSRPRPLPPVVVGVTGRAVDAAPTALALVALAGVVAVLATRGHVRQIVGAVLALTGVGLIVRPVTAAGAVGATRARDLVRSARPTADVTAVPAVVVHGGWAAVTVGCGVLVAAAGVAVLCFGHRWRSLSARYESPVGAPTQPDASGGPAADRLATAGRSAGVADAEAPAEPGDPDGSADARRAAALWSALDRGHDPTRDA